MLWWTLNYTIQDTIYITITRYIDPPVCWCGDPPVGGPSPPGFEGGDAQGLWFCVSSICSVLVVYVALPAR